MDEAIKNESKAMSQQSSESKVFDEPLQKKKVKSLSDIEELVFLSRASMRPNLKSKMFRFIGEYHSESPELKYIMGQGARVESFCSDLEELANKIITKNQSKDAQGAALYLLAAGKQKAADYLAILKELGLTVDEYIELALSRNQ